MKIEIKPFNDRVRFALAVTSIRQGARTGAAKPERPIFRADTPKIALSPTKVPLIP
jgi:hypothetical protein